jgi:hypothetical protein
MRLRSVSKPNCHKVKPGELTRWYIVNAGPRDYLSFNFAAGMVNIASNGFDNILKS